MHNVNGVEPRFARFDLRRDDTSGGDDDGGAALTSGGGDCDEAGAAPVAAATNDASSEASASGGDGAGEDDRCGEWFGESEELWRDTREGNAQSLDVRINLIARRISVSEDVISDTRRRRRR